MGSFGKEAPILYGEPKAINQAATGVSPALSPQADWIAYFASDTIRLVRQDATQDHQLVDIGPLGSRERHFAVTPDGYPDRAPGCSYRPPLLSWTASAISAADSATSPLTDTVPDWTSASFVAREGKILTLQLDGSGEVIRVDLSRLGVSDCRVDCFADVMDNLDSVSDRDELCIGYVYVGDGAQQGKLWVNRYTCYAGGASYTAVVADALQDASPGRGAVMPRQEWQIEKQRMRRSRSVMSDVRISWAVPFGRLHIPKLLAPS